MPCVLRKLSWQSTQHIPTMVMSYGRTIHIGNDKSEICPIMKPSPVLVPYNLPCCHHRIILVLVALVVGIIKSSNEGKDYTWYISDLLGDYMLPIPPYLRKLKKSVDVNVLWSWTGKLLATMLPVQESSMGSQPLLTGVKPYQPKAKTVNQPNPIRTRIR